MTPAVAAAGDAMPKDCWFDVTPESFTVICAVPGRAKREPGIVASIFTLPPNDVERAVLFQETTDEDVNPVPFTFSVVSPDPATV